ncbi:predicted protein [Naegleria gruberi]|uniref:Predicted protein n=1 Tax=Naegleria gruberi TaxID=5762 RepID=D2V9C8_NAEGR|nr:uncharacterized protein NAEGRDRAFT_47667 [Naegleria gruberi]EFC46437.1 predicted protein [Naegleria gruberi]|eukprot:XP_002679181.1 predicted protein [Naegleria gruberi strain NEG-M]
MSGNPFNLLSISIAEFDKLSGNSLTHTYPTDVHLEKYYPTSNIADKCIPDGAHIYHEDQTGIILPITEDNTELIQVLHKYISSFKFTTSPTPPKPIPSSPSSNIPNNNDNGFQNSQYLYGSVFFRNKLDDRVRRGAIQKSILVVTTKPLFTLFIPLMRDAIDRISPYVTIGDQKLSEHVYVCGMTNPLLENSKYGWDYYASIAADNTLSVGSVRFPKISFEGSDSPLRIFPPKLVKSKHSQSYSGELRLSPKKTPTSIKSIYRKLNPFISSKNESQFSQKDLISQVVSDGELEFLWPYIMPNSESMLDWTVTGHVTLYKMTLCIKDGLNTFYSRHSGPLSHKYEKVLANIHFILGKLFKENEEVIYSQEQLAYLDRKSLDEKEKILNEQTAKNKRDSSFLHIKLQKPLEQEYMVINSEVKQTSQRSLFVHKVVRLQLDSNKQYTFLENPEYFVYVVNRVSEEQTELTQVHVIRATNLSEKRDKYTYFSSALETRKLLIERLDKDATDYSNIVVSDSDSSEDEDLGSSE